MSSTAAPQPFARRQFASDNYAGICPEAWRAMAMANTGHARAYGEDEWTRRACDAMREFFQTDCDVFFTFNGTAANSLVLASLCRSYHSVVCNHAAHIETDECGAPEFFSNGTKILHIDGENGKPSLAAIEHTVKRRTDIHYPKPRVLSLTQSTELGTIYQVEELRERCDLAHRFGLKVHVDGARFANALAALGVEPREISWKAGVDVLCFGGTKQGMPVGEAVVFFDRELGCEFDYRCKQAGQLASKMRFISAPWIGMLEERALLRHAANANRHATMLSEALRAVPGVRILFPTEANAVFVEMPPALVEALHGRGWHFYTFIGTGGARFMCSWDITDEDVNALVADVRELAGA